VASQSSGAGGTVPMLGARNERKCRLGDTVARITRLLMWENWLPENRVPKNVVAATCELARELLIVDRTAAPPGEGLKYYNAGGVQTGYDKTDTRPVISPVAQAMLVKFGSLVSAKSGAVRLVRA